MCLFQGSKISKLFIIIYSVLNFPLSSAYQSVVVTGEYPTVLPNPSNRQAVGYDKSSNKILIIGGSNSKQVVEFDINDMTFNDLGTDYMSVGTSGVQFYTQNTNTKTNLWMINGGGSAFLTMDIQSRNIDQPATDFPVNVSPHACLASHKNYLFVVGGWNNSEMQRIVQIYDISTGQWITNTPLMQDSRSVCGCIVNGNRLYVVAGLQSDTAEWISVSDVNNIAQQQWRYVNGNLPQVLRGNTVVNYGDEIIVLGGRTGDDVYISSIPVINTKSNKFSIQGTLGDAIDEAAAIIVGKRVYIFGGLDYTNTVTDSYQYVDLPDIVVASSISGGSIFLIILFVSVCIYCIGGYVSNGYKSKKWGDVQENIPQLSFWKKVPLLVYTGCKITHEYVQGKVNGNSNQQEQLIETDDDDNAL